MKKITTLLLALICIMSAQAITVSEALAIGNELEQDAITTESYTIVGYVNVIKSNDMASHGNMTFWIADAPGALSSSSAGALQVYRGKPDRELVQGDKIQVVAKLKKYYSTIETTPSNAPVTWLESTETTSIPLPELGDGRIRVFAQNMQNYYYHYDNSESDRANYDHAYYAEKTRKMVDAILAANPDVIALCEVEAQPEVLAALADSLNARVEGTPYTALEDGINVAWDTYDNNIKSGFVYNNTTIKPYGGNYPASTANYYKYTQRIQAFEELLSNERFTLTMNHFRAKTSEDSESTRIMNANHLISALNSYAEDPDILILGDLNCTVGEEPMTILINAGYEEQILKYDDAAFSHCYNNEGNLIDHALANASMAAQITGAGVYHVCAPCGPYASDNYTTAYSDHDAYIVAFNLPLKQAGECEDVDVTLLQTGGSNYSPMEATNVSGSYKWLYNASYGATCQNKGGENWLFTPAYDLSDKKYVSLLFEHTIGYANNMTEDQTLWVTSDYQGSVAGSTWQQLEIPTYPAGTNWTYVSASVTVPLDKVGANTVFAFKYNVPSSATNTPKWEIKNLKIKATCKGTAEGIEDLQTDQRARKTLENGQLILTLPDGTKYNVIGLQIR